VFAFLFLIPFVVDPAITTILADYDNTPVTCIVTDYNFGEGLRNCTWSSCREGKKKNYFYLKLILKKFKLNMKIEIKNGIEMEIELKWKLNWNLKQIMKLRTQRILWK
jgi:hypothetical protein